MIEICYFSKVDYEHFGSIPKCVSKRTQSVCRLYEGG